MSKNPDSLKNMLREHSEKLARLGIELAKNQFSYKVENKPAKEYWQKRIEDFKKYNERGMEYYNEIHSLMNVVNQEESQMFLLRIAEFRQIGIALLEIMEKIKNNPSIMDSKDKQQSQWSRELKIKSQNRATKA